MGISSPPSLTAKVCQHRYVLYSWPQYQKKKKKMLGRRDEKDPCSLCAHMYSYITSDLVTSKSCFLLTCRHVCPPVFWTSLGVLTQVWLNMPYAIFLNTWFSLYIPNLFLLLAPQYNMIPPLTALPVIPTPTHSIRLHIQSGAKSW